MPKLLLASVALLLPLAACNAPANDSARESTSATEQTSPSDPSLVTKGALEGRFFVSGPINEGDLARDSTHFYAWLEGAAAKELYQRLPEAPARNACEDGHAWIKGSRSVSCTTSADSTAYRCYFAIDVAEEELAPGYSC